jgi:hypothetical protein
VVPILINKRLGFIFLILGSILVLFLLIFSLLKNNQQKRNSTLTISGKVQSQTSSESPTVLAGIQVSLIKERQGKEILKSTDTEVSQRKALQSNDPLSNEPYNSLRKQILEIKSSVLQKALTTAQADIDGNFKLENIPEGDYFLYAHYITPYMTIWWLIPTTVEGESLQINLDDDAVEAYSNHDFSLP